MSLYQDQPRLIRTLAPCALAPSHGPFIWDRVYGKILLSGRRKPKLRGKQCPRVWFALAAFPTESASTTRGGTHLQESGCPGFRPPARLDACQLQYYNSPSAAASPKTDPQVVESK